MRDVEPITGTPMPEVIGADRVAQPNYPPKNKALAVLNAATEASGLGVKDQLEVAAALAALAAARFMEANGTHSRAERKRIVRAIVDGFEKRLRNHLRDAGDPAAL